MALACHGIECQPFTPSSLFPDLLGDWITDYNSASHMLTCISAPLEKSYNSHSVQLISLMEKKLTYWHPAIEEHSN